jgi:PPOX class probable F420-dependent enzyme
MPASASELERLERSWAVLLTTFKRDGTAVATPVNLAVEGARAYFRSYAKAWKTKRLRRDAKVELAPSSPRGKPRGPAVSGTARLLRAEETAHARTLLARRHPVFQRVLIPAAHRLARHETLHYEVTIDPPEASMSHNAEP